MAEVLLGVDIGTSSSKGVLTDADGDILATATRPHGVSFPGGGRAEHDAEAVWWTDFSSICGELRASPALRGRGIAGVCVSGIGPCLLPTDGAGAPLRPAMLYGIDTRATREIVELTERF